MPFRAHLDSCKNGTSTPSMGEILLLVQLLKSRARRRLEKKEIPKILVKFLWNNSFFSKRFNGETSH